MNVLVEHAPHIVIAVVMFVVVLWLWLENVRSPPGEDSDQAIAGWVADRQRYVGRHARAGVAGPAMLLLLVIVGVSASGAWLYALNFAKAPRTTLIVIAHCILGVAVLVVFWRKQRHTGKARLMSAVRHGRLLEAASSAVSLSLLVPLTATGVLAIFFPKASGLSASLHLLVAAWWAILIAIHLRQYLMITFRTWRARRVSAGISAHPGEPALVGPALAVDRNPSENNEDIGSEWRPAAV